MTRRLVVLMVGLVTATLVIAGLGTLVLANVRARADTETNLREQAFNTAANVALFFDESDGEQLTEEQQRQRLRTRRCRDTPSGAGLRCAGTSSLIRHR